MSHAPFHERSPVHAFAGIVSLVGLTSLVGGSLLVFTLPAEGEIRVVHVPERIGETLLGEDASEEARIALGLPAQPREAIDLVLPGAHAGAARTAPSLDGASGQVSADETSGVTLTAPSLRVAVQHPPAALPDEQPTVERPVSGFAVAADTAAMGIARSYLDRGLLPPPQGIRPEAVLNAVDYDYPRPAAGDPFAVDLEAAPHPWKAGHHVLRVGVQAAAPRTIDAEPMHLTLLVDGSGSMDGAGRMDLVKASLHELVAALGAEDTVSIVRSGQVAQLVLDATPTSRASEIHTAIEALEPRGTSDLAAGLRLAYAQSWEAFLPGIENRVVLFTDGASDLARARDAELLHEVDGYADRGITFTAIGVGGDRGSDELLEDLAVFGDGSWHHVDTLAQARGLLEEQLGRGLKVVARDVKLQLHFDPAVVSHHRLVGYEERTLSTQAFRDDAVEAGELHAGGQATAVYELRLRDDGPADGLLARLAVRAKPRGADLPAREWLTELPARLVKKAFGLASRDLRMAFGLASFAELLRGSQHASEATYGRVQDVLRDAVRREDPEQLALLDLVGTAGRLSGERLP